MMTLKCAARRTVAFYIKGQYSIALSSLGYVENSCAAVSILCTCDTRS